MSADVAENMRIAKPLPGLGLGGVKYIISSCIVGDMYEDDNDENPRERTFDPKAQANEKADEFRMYAELGAIFEGTRKWDAEIIPGLDMSVARDIQQTMARLAKSKAEDSPVIPAASIPDAQRLLNYSHEKDLATNHYHVSRRPGEVMLARWLIGDEVAAFYERLQAHYEAGIAGFMEDERQATEWQNDPKKQAFIKAMDDIKVTMEQWYAREAIKQHKAYILSTRAADELNIQFLTDHIMGISPADLVGEQSAPPDNPTDQDLAWFFKLFSLRGMINETEHLCFFTFLQKSDDGF